VKCCRCDAPADSREIRCTRPDKKAPDSTPKATQGYFCDHHWKWAMENYIHFEAVEHAELELRSPND